MAELRKITQKDVDAVLNRSGAKLADLSPDATGIPWADWQRLDIEAQCRRWQERTKEELTGKALDRRTDV